MPAFPEASGAATCSRPVGVERGDGVPRQAACMHARGRSKGQTHVCMIPAMKARAQRNTCQYSSVRHQGGLSHGFVIVHARASLTCFETSHARKSLQNVRSPHPTQCLSRMRTQRTSIQFKGPVIGLHVITRHSS